MRCSSLCRIILFTALLHRRSSLRACVPSPFLVTPYVPCVVLHHLGSGFRVLTPVFAALPVPLSHLPVTGRVRMCVCVCVYVCGPFAWVMRVFVASFRSEASVASLHGVMRCNSRILRLRHGLVDCSLVGDPMLCQPGPERRSSLSWHEADARRCRRDPSTEPSNV